jgi:hypothetical protein
MEIAQCLVVVVVVVVVVVAAAAAAAAVVVFIDILFTGTYRQMNESINFLPPYVRNIINNSH